MRTKKLENFVSKHLKLSVKVAETLKTKQFIQQSQIKKDDAQNKVADDTAIRSKPQTSER